MPTSGQGRRPFPSEPETRPPARSVGREVRQRSAGSPAAISVWQFPRPPQLRSVANRLTVVVGGITIADTCAGRCVLERGRAPLPYFPPQDVRMTYLRRVRGPAFSEWQGIAHFFDVCTPRVIRRRAAWAFSDPLALFRGLTDFIAFNCRLVDACYVDDERAMAEPVGDGAGWVTRELTGLMTVAAA